MPRADLYNITSTLEAAIIAVQGFNPLILGVNAPAGAGEDFETSWVQSYAVQTVLADMVAAGFSSSDAEYLAAQQMRGQKLKPSVIKVGKVVLTAQVDTVTISGGDDGDYTVTINGVDYTYAATSKTPAEIATALAGLVNAGSEPVTAVPSTADVVLTADVAGQPFTTAVDGTTPANLTLVHTTDNHGYSESLQAIYAEDANFWGSYPTSNTAANLLELVKGHAAIEWGEMVADTQAADVLANTAGNIAAVLKAAGYERYSLWYHAVASEYMGAAILGNRLGIDPDKHSSSWNGVNLVGVAVDDALTSTQQTNLETNGVGYYMTHGAQGATMFGTSGATENYVDNILVSDWFRIRTIERMIATNQQRVNDGRKIPFNDSGFLVLLGDAKAQAAVGVAAEHISDDKDVPEDERAVFDFPKLAAVSAADKAARNYTFSYSLPVAGSVERVTGTIKLRV